MLPGVRATEMFEPVVPVEQVSPQPPDPGHPELTALVTAGLSAAASQQEGWRADRSDPTNAPSGAGLNGRTPASRLARTVHALSRRLQLPNEETSKLATLAGHLVDLELTCTIDVGTDGAAEVTRGGRFIHDHYWQQSAPRHTRRMTVTIRHHGISKMNCTAIVDDSDGSQHSANDGLTCSYDAESAMITVTCEYLCPGDAVTVRW